MQEHRCFYIDNIRAFLIFLVVLGHLLEQVFFPGSGALYRLIYTFHMPAFAFLSGLCFRKKPFSHLVKTLLYPYFLFQTLFLLFDAYEKHAPLEMQYTTPYWALWYLLALFFWRLMANSLNFSVPAAKFFVPCGLAVALLAGLDSSIGYYLSLSRCLVLFPFFLAGAWIQANGRAQFEAIIHHPGLRHRRSFGQTRRFIGQRRHHGQQQDRVKHMTRSKRRGHGDSMENTSTAIVDSQGTIRSHRRIPHPSSTSLAPCPRMIFPMNRTGSRLILSSSDRRIFFVSSWALLLPAMPALPWHDGAWRTGRSDRNSWYFLCWLPHS